MSALRHAVAHRWPPRRDITAHTRTRDAPGTLRSRRHSSRSCRAAWDAPTRVAHCHLGRGKLYRRAGKREQADEHLTTATTMYREMDMRFWLEQAEAEMGA